VGVRIRAGRVDQSHVYAGETIETLGASALEKIISMSGNGFVDYQNATSGYILISNP
jgi:hypothetical protein